MKSVKVLGFEIPVKPFMSAAEHELIEGITGRDMSTIRTDVEVIAVFVSTRLDDHLDVDAVLNSGDDFDRAAVGEAVEVLTRPFFEAQATLKQNQDLRRAKLTNNEDWVKRQLGHYKTAVKELTAHLKELRERGGNATPF